MQGYSHSFPYHLFSNICAVAFGFSTFPSDGCDDACDKDCNSENKQMMDVSLFLQIVGISMIVCTSFNMFIQWKLCPPSRDHPDIPSKTGLTFESVYLIFCLIMVIVGLVLWSQITVDCGDSPQAHMMLAWCIFYVIIVLNAGRVYYHYIGKLCDKQNQ